MAVPTDAERFQIFNSILGRMRREPGKTRFEIARDEFNAFGGTTHGFQISTFRAIALRAEQSRELAATLQSQLVSRPSARDVPSDVGIDPARPRYLYSVVITAENYGGFLADTRVDYRSDVPLSFAEVEELARSELGTDDSAGRGEVRNALQTVPGTFLSFHLISVVRR